MPSSSWPWISGYRCMYWIEPSAQIAPVPPAHAAPAHPTVLKMAPATAHPAPHDAEGLVYSMHRPKYSPAVLAPIGGCRWAPPETASILCATEFTHDVSPTIKFHPGEGPDASGHPDEGMTSEIKRWCHRKHPKEEALRHRQHGYRVPGLGPNRGALQTIGRGEYALRPKPTCGKTCR